MQQAMSQVHLRDHCACTQLHSLRCCPLLRQPLCRSKLPQNDGTFLAGPCHWDAGVAAAHDCRPLVTLHCRVYSRCHGRGLKGEWPNSILISVHPEFLVLS